MDNIPARTITRAVRLSLTRLISRHAPETPVHHPKITLAQPEK